VLYYLLFFFFLQMSKYLPLKSTVSAFSLLLSCDAVLFCSNGNRKTNNTLTTAQRPNNTTYRHAELNFFNTALKFIHFHGTKRTKYIPDIYIGGELSVMWLSDRTVQEDSTTRRLTNRVNKNEDPETFKKTESETSAPRNGLTQSTWTEKKNRIT